MNLTNKNILLFDVTNLAKRVAFSTHCHIDATTIDYQVFNFTIWNSIFTACVKHKATGVILASDNGSWRKIVYPIYKQSRKLATKKQIESGTPSIDWEEFFSNFNKFMYTLKTNLPIIYLSEKNCEADDVIGILAKTINQDNKVTIISGDMDYKQCLKHDNVKLWDPGGFQKNAGFVELDCDADDWVKVMSLHGQQKDNILNVFTRLDFPTEYNIMRESAEIAPVLHPRLPLPKAWDIVRSGRLEEWLKNDGPLEAKKKNAQIEKENVKRVYEGKQPKALYAENVEERYAINHQVISFDSIPKVLEKRVLQQLQDYTLPEETDFYKFFKKMTWNKPLDEFSRVEKVLYNLY